MSFYMSSFQPTHTKQPLFASSRCETVLAKAEMQPAARFTLKGLSWACPKTEIQRRFSSSSLPPYFVFGRLSAFLFPRNLSGLA